ncbi:PilX N-terminal domain-containing pilus assembly protein [Roseateles cellulosilyticus]|uniref:PilX N-terminal domain-containing pilus assembly protein n=1 Tax=Pelomonas cellulosilytica TaxID=2906762 RepID=A0ABS8XT04_9BURK|nr:PilX N-terminal domain-containing pilus assembly protein [Pelomonas sp. P8]MCE4555844.1 PilX N-terminal domain-containing pilus assembly protein [Pelomonas sp. P8]
MTRSLVRQQAGAATLIVVMMLFLVMALLAAYANRGQLFEQRVSGTYGRAALAQQAAEAGVEWTLAQLNGTAIDNSCKPVAAGGQRFVDRYLSIDGADRSFTWLNGEAKGVVDCARDAENGSWSCRCPAADSKHAVRDSMQAEELTPSFAILLPKSKGAGTLELTIQGCTDSSPDRCLPDNLFDLTKAQLATIKTSALVALVSAVRTPPSMPLVVKGDIQSAGAGLGLHNTDPKSGGLLLQMGGNWPDKLDTRLDTVPGASLSQAVVHDATLNDPKTDVFKMYMGATSARYVNHPALRKLACDGDCASALEDAYAAGQRIVWIAGDLRISSNKVLGTLDDPMLIVATGAVALTGPFQINGMLVAQGDLAWTNTSGMPSLINGIVLVGGAMATQGAVDIVYQQKIANQLRNRMGSFVRVPGGWTDSPPL